MGNSVFNSGTQTYGSPVYVSKTGETPSVYTNPRGTLSYTMVKTGATRGTTTGTANSNTSFTDTYNSAIISTTNYTLSISDANTGQSYTYVNKVTWGLV